MKKGSDAWLAFRLAEYMRACTVCLDVCSFACVLHPDYVCLSSHLTEWEPLQ